MAQDRSPASDDVAPGPSEPEVPTSGEAPPPLPADIAALDYEAARDELAAIVGTLESGAVGLEESMRLWQRGEFLARHCESWLDAAQARLKA